MKYYVVSSFFISEHSKMSLLELMTDAGANDYYDRDFKHTLEAHMAYLRAASSTTTVAISAYQTVTYKGCLYDLFTELGLPPYMHWVTMRLNDFISPRDFGEGVTSLLIPSPTELEQLRQSWAATQTIIA